MKVPRVHLHVAAALLMALSLGLSVATTTSSASPTVTWQAGMETGGLTEWNRDGGGDINVNTGNGVGVASTDVAHTGKYSLKMTVNSHGSTNGVRFFRWDSQTGYYSAWYYFPQVYSGMSWWNVFQWKDTKNNPAWVVNVTNVGGKMRFWLYDAYTGGVFNQSVADIPVGKWVQLEAYYKIASDMSGRVTIYQDGQQIIDEQGVQTAAPGTGIYWGVANYTDNIVPSTATIYVDDAAISTDYIPGGGTSAQPTTPTSASPKAAVSALAARDAPITAAPRFVLGFATLANLLGGKAGTPLENEHHGVNGDGLQQTTTGLMVWRKADNWTAFTNGSWTWVNGPYGLQDRSNDTRFPWEAQ